MRQRPFQTAWTRRSSGTMGSMPGMPIQPAQRRVQTPTPYLNKAQAEAAKSLWTSKVNVRANSSLTLPGATGLLMT